MPYYLDGSNSTPNIYWELLLNIAVTCGFSSFPVWKLNILFIVNEVSNIHRQNLTRVGTSLVQTAAEESFTTLRISSDGLVQAESPMFFFDSYKSSIHNFEELSLRLLPIWTFFGKYLLATALPLPPVFDSRKSI